nr:hypothetical protein Iba_scaffold45456CG0010 [Ipomoea batatas]
MPDIRDPESGFLSSIPINGSSIPTWPRGVFLLATSKPPLASLLVVGRPGTTAMATAAAAPQLSRFRVHQIPVSLGEPHLL